MLGDYFPRAIQWCSTDEIPDDLVSINICKCYPSVLINNGFPILVYSIHDTIKKYLFMPQFSRERSQKVGQ